MQRETKHVFHVPVSATDALSIQNLTDEERSIALCSGAACLRQSRKMLACQNEQQMHDEIESGFRATLDAQAAALDAQSAALVIEKTLSEERRIAANDRLDKEVETVVRHKTELLDRVLGDKEEQVRRLSDLLRQRDLDLLESREELRQHGMNQRAKMDEEVAATVRQHDQARDHMIGDVLARTTDMLEQQQQMQQQMQKTRTSTEIGAIGEEQFVCLAEKTFMDFEGFQLLDVHAQPHKGDAHLVVKDLIIMVDAKAYKRRVDASQIEKMKADLRCNAHIPFAWLVSLNTGIDRKDGVAFSFEWISETQCVAYVNNLLGHGDPGLLLKTLFYLCREQLVKIRASEAGVGADAQELATLRDDRRRTEDKVDGLRKRLREVKSAISGLRGLHDELEKEVAGLLNTSSVSSASSAHTKHYAVLSEWWSATTEEESGQGTNSLLKSPSLWVQFKRDHADIGADMTVSEFKDALCLIVPCANVSRPNGNKGCVDIQGYRLRAVSASAASSTGGRAGGTDISQVTISVATEPCVVLDS